MGLKDKAISIKKISGLDSKLSKSGFDQLSTDHDFSPENQKILDNLKKKGIIKKEDLLNSGISPLEHQLSRYLLPDDLSGSTLPVESDYSLNSRIEALINLIELCKELATIENIEDLWESILFSILGQIGSREAAIFIKDESRYSLKASKGFIFPNDLQMSKRSGIERVLQKDLNIHYGQKVISNISGDELDLFKSLQIELIVPIVQFEDLYGFIFIGKSIASGDYTIEDLLYLKLLGEIIGSFYQTIQQAEVFNSQKVIWNSREKVYQKYIYFQQQLQASTNPEIARSIFENYMSDVFTFQAYMLFILNEKEEYELISHNGLQQQSVSHISFTPNNSVLFRFQQQRSWFTDKSLLMDDILKNNLSKEDQSIISETSILPLFFHDSLYGFFILLKANNESPMENMSYAQNIIITYFWYYLSHNYLLRAEKNLVISITDPLHAIKSEIVRAEKKLEKKGTPFALIIVNFMNYNRLDNLFGERYVKAARAKIKKYCRNEFHNIKFISELFTDKFLIIFENIEKSQLWVNDKNLNRQIVSLFPEEYKRPLLHNRLYARPEDKEKSLEQLLIF